MVIQKKIVLADKHLLMVRWLERLTSILLGNGVSQRFGCMTHPSFNELRPVFGRQRCVLDGFSVSV